MTGKKPPQKPTNLSKYNCNITIGKQNFTKLEISPDYKEKNQEFKQGLVEKGIKLTKIELAKVLMDDNLLYFQTFSTITNPLTLCLNYFYFQWFK